MTDQKHTLVCDIECYRDYFLVMFKSVLTGKVRAYEMYEGKPLDHLAVRSILENYRIVTFNGNNYDVPMLMLVINKAVDCEGLKRASDWIIVGENRNWQFYDHYQLRAPEWIDHIDLIEVAFGDGSLKLYGGRLHSKRLQDLPIEPEASISPAQRQELIDYCGNDLQTTIDLFTHLKPQIELREKMSADYGIDLRSKSDAQIAEAVIKRQVGYLLGERVSRPNIPPGTTFKYRPPAFLKFRSEQMLDKFSQICEASFVINETGSPIEPPALDGATVRIGAGVYRLGIGGLHSSEEKVAHFADDDSVLMDIDVTSYYPSIILQCGLYPRHLTKAFLKVYHNIFTTRVEAKRAGNSTIDKVLKIVLNGSFGKFGSRWSTIYAPDLMIQVTVTGQLALLMLIEAFEAAGISVVSANTDGIVIKAPKTRLDDVRGYVKQWERATGFTMEETQYRALYSRDVNAYMAVKIKGGIKGKGPFAETSISKNPSNQICVEAVQALLEHGTPLAQTIISCRDIRKFLTVRTVKGGAIRITNTNYDEDLRPAAMRDLLLAQGWAQVVPGPLTKARFACMADEPALDVEAAYRMHCGEDEFEYIGKVVRWYYGANERRAIHYKAKNKSGNRNKVPNSDGAVACMQLPDIFPSDIDYSRYIDESNEILKDIGAL